ncbi:protoporphyrinogen oxidase HemJ [Ravibacter arvi]|uniref:Protoporphyrinogen IX oxidase n=1 Tax=Ravibacter arvi TaxID=2051041 RepID=A0ABP8M5A6_9BACT
MYLYIKAIHIISVVSWFAGLFYLPRLLVYHTEAQVLPEEGRKSLGEHLVKWQRLLFNAIMVPAMCLTLASGVTMLFLVPDWLSQGWMHLKLAFVLVLLYYHFYTRKLLLEVRKGVFRWTSVQLRLWNELATILLVAIVFLVVLKSSLDWIWGVLGVVLFAVSIMVAVKLVNRNRK